MEGPTVQELLDQLADLNTQLDAKYKEQEQLNVEIIKLERQAEDLKKQISQILADQYKIG